MRAAVEHHFYGTTGLTGITGGTAGGYNSSVTMISSLLRQATGATIEDRFVSTKTAAIANITDLVASTPHQMPHVVKWSDNIYWIFLATAATNVVTRFIAMFQFDSTTSTITYNGYITTAGTTVAGNKITRSLRALLYRHTTGTVSTSGSSTTITGSGSGFQSERIAVGARIGFGTTDATQVTTWYEITAINSDTELVINSPVTLSGSTSYVIEELRLAYATTNATLINGGVHLVKGLHPGVFGTTPPTISEATTVDNIRAVYLLTDAAVAGAATATVTYSTTNILSCSGHGLGVGDVVFFTTTNTLPTGLSTNTAYYVISTNLGANQFSVSTTYNGSIASISAAGSGTHTVHSGSSKIAATLALDDEVSKTDHPIYLVNATSTTAAVTVTKYNVRAALTVGALTGGPASGTSPSAFVFKTAPNAITGTVSQLNSGRIFTPNHGGAGVAGVKSLFFCTTTRVFRAPVANLTSGALSWVSDSMLENPPGGTTVYSALSSMSQVDYSATIDRLFVTNTAARFGTYVTPYNSSNNQFEKYIGSQLNRVKVGGTPSGASDGLFPSGTLHIWTEDGWMFAVSTGTSNWLYIFPFAADAYYNSTTNQHIITPKLATPNATKLYHVYLDHQEYAGDYGLGFPVETYRIWYRTTGIDDNSGAWTEVGVGADLQSVSPSDYIQFKIAFDIMGEICVPTRIYSICVTFEDSSQDSHYQPSLTKSSASSRIFAWKQVTAWGTNIPNLQIRLYNADTGFLVLDDTVTASASGTWQYSTDGSTWNSWSASADTVGNYIRYTATSLPNNITVKALLTQA